MTNIVNTILGDTPNQRATNGTTLAFAGLLSFCSIKTEYATGNITNGRAATKAFGSTVGLALAANLVDDKFLAPAIDKISSKGTVTNHILHGISDVALYGVATLAAFKFNGGAKFLKGSNSFAVPLIFAIPIAFIKRVMDPANYSQK